MQVSLSQDSFERNVMLRAALKTHTQKKITIKHNYSLKTVGKGPLYMPILAQHSTEPLIATLLLVHITFCTSYNISVSHAEGIASIYFTALSIEQL